MVDTVLKLKLCAETDTEALGGALAQVAAQGARIYLHGDLGTGKTTLVRGFLRALGHAGPVRSPTYTLVEPYEHDGRSIYHLDLYRVGDPEELEYLGLRDLEREDAVLLVEWPEQGEGALREADLQVHIRYADSGRNAVIEAVTPRGRDLLQRLRGQLGSPGIRESR